MTTKDTTSMTASETAIAAHRPEPPADCDPEPPPGTNRSSITTVTRTIAAISQSIRRNSAVLRDRGGSSTISSRRPEPEWPSVAISSARALENEERAASALLNSPATSERTPASTSSQMSRMLIGSSRPAVPPLLEQPGLQVEHLLVLVGLGVVVAEQVQDPVHREQLDLVLGGMPGLRRLPLGDRHTQHQVAEDALLGLLVDQSGAQLVHREGEHVGGPGLLHPLLV